MQIKDKNEKKIDQLIEKENHLKELEEKTEHLKATSITNNMNAKKLRNKYLKKNKKWTILLLISILSLIIFLFLLLIKLTIMYSLKYINKTKLFYIYLLI